MPRALLILLALFVLADPAFSADPSQKIRGGTELNFRPYSFMDPSGQPSGFGPELLRAVVEKMGRPLEVRQGPWDQVWADLVAGKLDVLPTVTRTTGREALVDFSFLPGSVSRGSAGYRQNVGTKCGIRYRSVAEYLLQLHHQFASENHH